MSRITEALNKLRVKCTEAGHSPSGNGIADIIDCIAEHFRSGGGMVVNATVTVDSETEALNVTADKTIAEIFAAAKIGAVTANIIRPDDQTLYGVPLSFATEADGIWVTFGIKEWDGEDERFIYCLSGENYGSGDVWTVADL